MRESEKINKYLDLTKRMKKLWNKKVNVIPIIVGVLRTFPKNLEKRLVELEIRRRIETTTLLRSARIFRRVLETWLDLLPLKALVKYHQLIVVGKTRKYWNNNNNDNNDIIIIIIIINNKGRLCRDWDKTIKHIINECGKLAQNVYKTKHDWELCKKFEFHHTNKWYMHNPEFVLENEMHKLFWDFEIQTDHLFSCKVKLKESEKRELARQQKKNYGTWKWGDIICNWYARYSHQRIGKRTEWLWNKKTSEDHPTAGVKHSQRSIIS